MTGECKAGPGGEEVKYAEEGQKLRYMPIRWKNIKDTAKPERPGWKSGKEEGVSFWDRDEKERE